MYFRVQFTCEKLHSNIFERRSLLIDSCYMINKEHEDERGILYTINASVKTKGNTRNQHNVVAKRRQQQTNYYLNGNIYVTIDYSRHGLFCSWLWYTLKPYRRKCMVCKRDNILTIGNLLLQWRLCFDRFLVICLWTIWTLGTALSTLRSCW